MKRAILFLTVLSMLAFAFGCVAPPSVRKAFNLEQAPKLPPGTLDLSISNENGQLISASVKIFRDKQEKPLQQAFSKTGVLTLPGFQPGKYQIRVQKKEYQDLDRVFTIEPQKTTHLRLVMVSAIGHLKVWVVDYSGRMIDGANVSVAGIYQKTKNGVAQFTLMSGKYTLEISKIGFNTITKKVTIEPKRTTPVSVALGPGM